LVNAFGHPASVLVLGGTSDIAVALVERLVAGGTRRVVLAGRDAAALGEVAVGFQGRAEVESVPFDAEDLETHDEVLEGAFGAGDVDAVVLAFGLLGDQERAETDPTHAVTLAQVNYVGAVSMCLRVAQRFRRQGHGTLVVMSSVAGERARRSNFVYGSTKAGLDALCQGLDAALAGSGARVMIVRPGFVKSKMTAHLDDVPLSVTPVEVADGILRGLQRRSRIVWVPGALRWVMTVLRHLPTPLFRRLPI
jgi:decaprenylphospho-beta-D-erythro-pentofuranosid-2-ulose 2-reductase